VFAFIEGIVLRDESGICAGLLAAGGHLSPMLSRKQGNGRSLGSPLPRPHGEGTQRDRKIRDFKPCSYGFRPLRRARDAIAEIHYLGLPNRNYEWVFEGHPDRHATRRHPLASGVDRPSLFLDNYLRSVVFSARLCLGCGLPRAELRIHPTPTEESLADDRKEATPQPHQGLAQHPDRAVCPGGRSSGAWTCPSCGNDRPGEWGLRVLRRTGRLHPNGIEVHARW
jgi:hypothetical protein